MTNLKFQTRTSTKTILSNFVTPETTSRKMVGREPVISVNVKYGRINFSKGFLSSYGKTFTRVAWSVSEEGIYIIIDPKNTDIVTFPTLIKKDKTGIGLQNKILATKIMSSLGEKNNLMRFLPVMDREVYDEDILFELKLMDNGQEG